MRELVVHVGPSRNARGGISRVIALLGSSALRDTYRLRFVSTVGSHVGNLAFPVSVLRLMFIMLTDRPELVHLHTASRGSFLRKSLLARLVKAASGEYAIHLHGGGFSDFYAGLSERRQTRVRRCFAEASAVFVVSRAMALFVAETLGVVEPIVVPNPIEFPDSPTTGLASGRVMSMGHLGIMKGTDVLIGAFAQSVAACPSLTLLLMGDGFSQHLKSLVEKSGLTGSVAVREWAPPDVVAEELSRSAIFALPSLAEGMPLSLLEAMASGLGCIATPVGGVTEILEDGVTGLIVPPGDTEALATAITTLAGDDLLRTRLGSAARERVREHSVNEVVEVIMASYRRLGVGTIAGDPR